MTNEELRQSAQDLEWQFNQYQIILTEAYNNMVELSESYDKLKKELNKREDGK